jgi:hypothetical protein
MTLAPGYADKEGAASVACVADFIVVNMVAEAATGKASPQAAARGRRGGRGGGTQHTTYGHVWGTVTCGR